ncbi:MAG: hypothetical protein KIT16_24045, partial [Rhodospirillaceae bacterium]|nr:hypothetical protein [Rhodospirillaceae bacterium]
MRILHVLPQIDAGGPARSLHTLLRHSAALGHGDEHRILALARRANPRLMADIAKMGPVPLLAPSAATADEQIGWADIVLFHYWNAPASVEFLCRPLPPMRLVLWNVTNGLHAPHTLLSEHAAAADGMMLTGPSELCPGAEIVAG